MPTKTQLEEKLAHASKRAKHVANTIAEEFLCPITQELPAQPVIAEDGKIYERTAIQKWFTKQETDHKKRTSPATNQEIGGRLLPALHVKNSIEKLVESKSVDGELANGWKKKLRQQRARDAKKARLIKKTETGSIDGRRDAMYQLGELLKDEIGTKEDEKKVESWYHKAAMLGHIKSMAYYGKKLANSSTNGSSKNLGFLYCVRAADHDTGCALVLAEALCRGQHGLLPDLQHAKVWLDHIRLCGSAKEKQKAADLMDRYHGSVAFGEGGSRTTDSSDDIGDTDDSDDSDDSSDSSFGPYDPSLA